MGGGGVGLVGVFFDWEWKILEQNSGSIVNTSGHVVLLPFPASRSLDGCDFFLCPHQSV